MSATAQDLKHPAAAGADLRLALIGAATVLFSMAALAAGWLGALSAGISTAIVLLGMGFALKLAWTYMARSASSASRARLSTRLSNTGLAIAAIAAVVAVPRLTKSSGIERLLIDLLAQLWTLAILSAVAAPVRTVGWRALLGAFLFGFLGLTALARYIGRPLVEALGTSSVLAAGVWVPLTEELCKMLPVLLILRLALRRTAARPALLDLVLIGAWAAAGFAVYENATYGRGGFSLLNSPLLSLILPSIPHGSAYGWSVTQTGHLVHTALIALGVGYTFLYRRRLSRPWIVATAAIAVALIEHISQNSIATGAVSSLIGKSLLVITMGGRLSALLLLAGIAYVLAIEWRALGGGFRPRQWLQLPPAEIGRRTALLAKAQMRAPDATPGITKRAVA